MFSTFFPVVYNEWVYKLVSVQRSRGHKLKHKRKSEESNLDLTFPSILRIFFSWIFAWLNGNEYNLLLNISLRNLIVLQRKLAPDLLIMLSQGNLRNTAHSIVDFLMKEIVLKSIQVYQHPFSTFILLQCPKRMIQKSKTNMAKHVRKCKGPNITLVELMHEPSSSSIKTDQNKSL